MSEVVLHLPCRNGALLLGTVSDAEERCVCGAVAALTVLALDRNGASAGSPLLFCGDCVAIGLPMRAGARGGRLRLVNAIEPQAVLATSTCGCLSYIDIDPDPLSASVAEAERNGRRVEVVSVDEATQRWHAQARTCTCARKNAA